MMDEQQKVNALINVGQFKVAEKAYDDILSNPGKKIGNALSTVLDFGNTILWPLKFLNEKTTLFFENNLRKYQKKLDQVDRDSIVEVPTEIAIPILHRFTYVTNEQLSDAFINLLSNASDFEKANLAHPGFISIIDRLSPDEAKILISLKGKEVIPASRLLAVDNDEDETSTYADSLQNFTGIDKIVNLIFPENIQVYLDNLESLGIISFKRKTISNTDRDFYEKIENEFYYLEIKEFLNQYPEYQTYKWERGVYFITIYGKFFMNSCF